MKFDPMEEFKEMSRVLKTYFGYDLRRRDTPLSSGKVYISGRVYIVDLIDPNNRMEVLCSKVSWSLSSSLQLLYEHMSREVIYDHNGRQITFPSFETAKELEMKLDLQGR